MTNKQTKKTLPVCNEKYREENHTDYCRNHENLNHDCDHTQQESVSVRKSLGSCFNQFK